MGEKTKIAVISLAGIIGGFFLLIALAVILFMAVLFLSFGDNSGFEGDKAKTYIEENLSLQLPDSADNLYYDGKTWIDSEVDIRMNLPPQDAWKLIKEISGKGKEDFVSVEHDFEILEQWKDEKLPSPVILKVHEEGKNIARTYIYDAGTQRLLIDMLFY